MVPKIMLEGGHAQARKRTIAAGRAASASQPVQPARYKYGAQYARHHTCALHAWRMPEPPSQPLAASQLVASKASRPPCQLDLEGVTQRQPWRSGSSLRI